MVGTVEGPPCGNSVELAEQGGSDTKEAALLVISRKAIMGSQGSVPRKGSPKVGTCETAVTITARPT